MNSDKHDQKFFEALLGERPLDEIDALVEEDPEARADWEEFQRLWSDLAIVLEEPDARVRHPHRASPGWSPRWLAVALAACLATFWLGSWSGSRTLVAEPPPGDVNRYALLLYAGASEEGPSDSELIQQVIQEQKNWTDELRSERRHILSEKLEDSPGVELVNAAGSIEELPESQALALRLGGLYVIEATSLEEATRIARSCPLLRYGGVVRVRAIDDV